MRGAIALADREMGDLLNLSSEQIASIQSIVDESKALRETAARGSGPSDDAEHRAAVEAQITKRLLDVLSGGQIARWQSLHRWISHRTSKHIRFTHESAARR